MDPAITATGAEVAAFAEMFSTFVANVERFIRGKAEVVRLAALCMISEGHLLIDDVPGVGKTSLARAMVASIDGSMRRIQFTPDLLPTDVTGVQVYDASQGEFVFHQGAVFANILLADEINRASPKTQSALLEVMEERQVTVDGAPYAVPSPFIVIATQNPVDHGGTYDLPEAQIDRFMMRVGIGYPSHEAETQILANRAHGQTPEHLRPVMTTDDLQQMIKVAHAVHLAPAVLDYIVTLTSATRKKPDQVRLGVSPRGSLALTVAAQTLAASLGRSFVTADDVKTLAPAVLAHRILLQPDAEVEGITSTGFLDGLLASIPVPQQRVSA